MPIYELVCECGNREERILPMGANTPLCNCGSVMTKGAGSISVLKIDGMFPSRKVWMDNYTPDSPTFSTGSLHGEHY